ncbi:hypothetical protein CC1G_03634 [Coprinopsis cinerea okayama7|uniref:Uncharacterized protein n=1 Tax=Coprinopsis cinerea (strain Okayama-7 / 130 / ATCC MYA-4618 / FGSC 9003) TaxID=240176 RepID=A8N1U1_COPC7|nr:hypothetical protein CC1G_03634 [Coprinopsis cinerea okayama7\|eukprot:XP_001828840.2 hypothetical protein CC1G_03634 [Coprinopsis cinerea okayama7\
MPPLPSREVLESMKRADLQRLCKDYGVRANLKTEALIDLLLETQSAPPPSPIRRSVSTRRSSRAEPSRTASLVIHDIEEKREQEEETMSTRESTPIALEQPPPPPALPPVRTRKAKELQTRLGVGRPKAAGGAGARAVTRASSTQRSRRGKPSRMLNPVEPTIEEEPETTLSVGVNGSPGTPNVSPPPGAAGPSGSLATVSDAIISERISEAVAPLKAQLQEMEQELRSLHQRNAELLELKTQLSKLEDLEKRYALLEAEVKELRSESSKVSAIEEELKELKGGIAEQRLTPLPSTPKAKSPKIPLINQGVLPSAFKAATYPPINDDVSPLNTPRREVSTAPSTLPHPQSTATTLGKRPRDSGTSDMTGILEEGEQDGFSEEELARKVLRPNKKRQRLSVTVDPPVAGPSRRPSDVAAQLSAPRIPSFTVYNGVEEGFDENFVDQPPPNNPLPDFFAPSPPLNSSSRPGTGSSHQEENQNPFNFNFVPMSSTPAGPSGPPASFMPPFPFPEPPNSPSPASNSIGYLGRVQDDRTDIFKSFGLPSPRRPRFPESESDETVDPAVLGGRGTSNGKQREVSSNDVAAGLGLTMVRTASATDPMNFPEPPPAKKTMYGTELEDETRFGDFGVEGVASGFWSGRR